MIMVYPLIYSRTKFSDYVSGFLVRPWDIDYKLASQYVGQVLEEVKYAGGVRYAVFSVGDYLIYGGTACVSSVLVDRILKEQETDELGYDYKDYQYDKAGRPITFFVGFGVRRCDMIKSDEIPQIDLNSTYRIYLDYLKRQWLHQIAQTQIVDKDNGIEVETIRYIETFRPEIVQYSGKNYIKNFDGTKYQSVINYFFHQMLCNSSEDYSFVSDVLPDTIMKYRRFKNISIFGMTPEEYIGEQLSNAKLQMTDLKEVKPEQDNRVQISRANKTYDRNDVKRATKLSDPRIYHSGNEVERDQVEKAGKKTPAPSYLVVVVLIILILLAILIMGLAAGKKYLKDNTKVVQVPITVNRKDLEQNMAQIVLQIEVLPE